MRLRRVLARCSSPLAPRRLRRRGGGGATGTATLWVTRDRGAEVLVDAEVAGRARRCCGRSPRGRRRDALRRPLRPVDRRASRAASSGQRDWFWFVNGYEGDRSAAEYRLRAATSRGGTTAAWEREGEARGRRRRLPRAVPARVRRARRGRPPCATRPGSRSSAPRARRAIGADVGRAARHAGRRRTRTCSRCGPGRTAPRRRAARRVAPATRSLFVWSRRRREPLAGGSRDGTRCREPRARSRSCSPRPAPRRSLADRLVGGRR